MLKLLSAVQLQLASYLKRSRTRVYWKCIDVWRNGLLPLEERCTITKCTCQPAKPPPINYLKPSPPPSIRHTSIGRATFHRAQRTNRNAQNSQPLFSSPIRLRLAPMHCGMIFFRWQKRVILNNKMSAKWSKLGVFTTWFLWDFGMEQTLGLDAV